MSKWGERESGECVGREGGVSKRGEREMVEREVSEWGEREWGVCGARGRKGTISRERERGGE